MEDNFRNYVSQWLSIQPTLFPMLEDELGELDESDREFVNVCTIVGDKADFAKYRWKGNGHPPTSRRAVFRLLLLKALRNLPTTNAAIELVRSSPKYRRLCGWEHLSQVPDKSTVSRVFKEFSEDASISSILTDLVSGALGRNGAFHMCHDSTAVEAREKGQRIAQSEDEKAENALEKQRKRTADENFALLPRHCDWGCKCDSKGKKMMWKGYKLHVCCTDGDIPVAAFLSSANLHDAKVMIPLMQKASESFDYFYDLADAGYDAAQIRTASAELNHVPIIDRNPRRGEKNVDDVGGRTVNIVDATTRRYFARSGIERVFSHLHDSHGGKCVRVRGAAKVFLHLMFGLLVIAGEQLLSAMART